MSALRMFIPITKVDAARRLVATRLGQREDITYPALLAAAAPAREAGCGCFPSSPAHS